MISWMKISAIFLAISGLLAQDQPRIKEPEDAGEFFFLGFAGDLKPLERQKIRGLVSKGSRSSVRFVQGEPLSFVVRVSSQDVDVAAIVQFIQLNARKSPVPFEVNRYGETSFKIKSKANLIPGEYALGLTTEKAGYCFGVDAVKTDLK